MTAIDSEAAPDRLLLAMSRIEILRHLGGGSLESGIIVASLLDDATVEAWTELRRRGKLEPADSDRIAEIGSTIRSTIARDVADEVARRSATR